MGSDRTSSLPTIHRTHRGSNGPRVALIAPYAPRPGAAGADSDRKGGVERYVASLARSLAAIGIDATVVASGEKPDSFHADGFDVIHFPRWSVMEGTPVFNPLALLKSLKGFDLLHSQATYPLISEFGAVQAKLARIPSVVTYHFQPTPLTPGGKALAMAYGLTAQRIIRAYDRILFSTRSYRQRTGMFSPADDEKIRFVPMGVDTDFFSIDQTVERENRFLFVGRLVPYKDIPLLISAFSLVSRKLPEHELCLVGTGPLESALMKLAGSKGLKVRFLGKQSDAELRALYRSSTATVLSSHDQQEAFGMTLLESMGCGTPVVTMNIPGVREVAALGGTAVMPYTAESFADEMVNTASRHLSAGERTEMHARVEERYSWTSVAKMTAEIYNEIL